MQTLQPQRLADAGIVDDQRRNAALGKRGRDAEQVDDLLGDIEPVEMNHAGPLAARPVGAGEQRGERRVPDTGFRRAGNPAR